MHKEWPPLPAIIRWDEFLVGLKEEEMAALWAMRGVSGS